MGEQLPRLAGRLSRAVTVDTADGCRVEVSMVREHVSAPGAVMEFTVRNEDGDFQVWVQLEKGDPTDMNESFIIGSCGANLDDAIAAAVAELEQTIAQLRQIVRRPAAARATTAPGRAFFDEG